MSTQDDRPITVWGRYDFLARRYEHNHIEFGYLPNWKPKPITELQEKAWRGGVWRRTYANLINNVVVELPL